MEKTVPDDKWAVITDSKETPTVGGYESGFSCECGYYNDKGKIRDGEEIECGRCGRGYELFLVSTSEPSREHPYCPDCHVPMTRGSGYFCPECEISLPTSRVETYDDVLREYQSQKWLQELQCGNFSRWHTHSDDEKIHHCSACCENCPDCDCPTDDPPPFCNHEETGDRANVLMELGGEELYRRLRTTLETKSEYDFPLENNLQKNN